MKIKNSSIRLLSRRTGAVIAAAALVANTACATQTVRELWDGLGLGAAISSKGSGPTSVGLDTNTTWVVSPTGQTGLYYDNGWQPSWEFGGLEYNGVLLSASGGGNGAFVYYGNNMTSLTNPATGQPYGNYSCLSYATRTLTTNAYIDFQANGTYYFSARIIKNYPWWHGDNSQGIGFASSGATNAHFVGTGFTRRAAGVDTDTNLGVSGVLPGFYAADGVTDLGNSVYISTGTLDQPGITGHPADSGGAYYPNATAPVTSSGGSGVDAYLLVGRLTTTSSGASTMDVKVYNPSDALDTDPSLITWSTTYSFTETNVMTRLLLWGYGQGPGPIDGIRVGTSYGEVIGLELFGHPTANPGSTVYAGTDITLGANAGLNTGATPMTFQWRSNSVDILDATNSTLALTNTTVNYTADYSVVVSNYYGMLTNVIHVTVNPAVPPFVVTQPVSITRYNGAASGAFKVVVDGTPPFTYQWKHAGTNFQAPTITSVANNTLTFGPISPALGGTFSVTITNQFGTTSSVLITNNVLVPAPGSYAAVLLTNSPYAYWRLDDSVTPSDTTLYDNWGNHGGNINYDDLTNNPANWTFGATGAAGVGFPTPHLAISKGNQFWTAPYRLNLPKLPYYSNMMTFTMWVKGGCELMARNGYGSAYGLELSDAGHTGTNTLRFDWGGPITWDSGITLPDNTWNFVAMVVEPSQVTMYYGTNKVSLNSVVSGALPVYNSDDFSDTAGLSVLAVGRNPWPWAEDGNGSQWASLTGTWSDIAVFYQSLTAEQVTNVYLAGVGVWIDATPDGLGNLNLNWMPGGTLQEATDVMGPYTDIGAATPPYSVPVSPMTASKFYRIKR